jgi:hypothetical protein
VNFNDPFEIGLVEVVESGKLALLIIANSIRKQCAILKNKKYESLDLLDVYNTIIHYNNIIIQ